MIEVLSNKDKARTRINVFHDSSSNWINLVKELIGNSLDVFPEDELHHITINLLSNTKVEYIDDGCGVPLEGTASNGLPNYQAIFEVDFAGSRYGNAGKTVGQNGVFFWTLAMTSKDFYIEVGRPNGNIYTVSYHKGDRVSDLKVIGKTDKTYTKVIFEPDDEVWTNPNYTFDEVAYICQSQASMGNVVISLSDSDNSKTFRYDNGISDFFIHMTKIKNFISDHIYFTKQTSQLVEKRNEEFGIDIEMIMGFSNDSNDDFKKDFLNTADLIKYGTINRGITTGIKNHVNRWLKASNKYTKGEKQITDEDVDLGLNYVCNVKSNYVEYVSQSKQATDAEHLKVALQRVMEEFLEVYSKENPVELEKIANQILINKRSREKANQTRLNIQKKLSGTIDISNRIKKFVDCRTKDTSKRELYIVEGDSALGSCKLGRDSEFQGIMPVRGKILNCLKSDYDKIFKSDIITDLLKVLGCGVEVKSKHNKDLHTFELDNLRWDKVIICTDADVDGYQIRTLILTMIFRLMPTLIKEGKVFIVESPLYEIQCKDIVKFAYSDREKDTIVSQLGKCHIQRSKGLGENTPDMMWATTMNPETRKLIQVTMQDAEDAANEFELLLGNDLDGRKQCIVDNFDKYLEVL